MNGLLKRKLKGTGEAGVGGELGGLLPCVPSSAPAVNTSSVTCVPKTWEGLMSMKPLSQIMWNYLLGSVLKQ